ncbi:MAG: hypothetical protein Q9Q40_14150 [Acidobacteriota bacterium]|nr:hypothetical protein [Acidobacteriota bacterium]
MKRIVWSGQGRIGLWDGRYLEPGVAIEVEDERAEELLARDSRWAEADTRRPAGRKKGDD